MSQGEQPFVVVYSTPETVHELVGPFKEWAHAKTWVNEKIKEKNVFTYQIRMAYHPDNVFRLES